MTLDEYTQSLAKGNAKYVSLPEASFMIDCIFENLGGSTSSAATIIESMVSFISFKPVGEVTQFKNNVSNQGSTLYSVSSTILLRNITSAYNTAVRGGVI